MAPKDCPKAARAHYRKILICLALMAFSGCGAYPGYSRTDETKYRLHNLKLVIQQFHETYSDRKITSLDVFAQALDHGWIAPGDLQDSKFDAWHNPLTIIPTSENSGIIVSNGPNGIYEAGKGDDISLDY